ncbi:MAG: hypothetical protein HRU24_18900 [Gammaproteobacteria bacterium]|nr:hypothetical protein [Gammaproteobacteria bacterium]
MNNLEKEKIEYAQRCTKDGRKWGTCSHDSQGNIISIADRTLEVKDLSNQAGEAYFQAWVDGIQDDGYSHNEAVRNALKRANEMSKST